MILSLLTTLRKNGLNSATVSDNYDTMDYSRTYRPRQCVAARYGVLCMTCVVR